MISFAGVSEDGTFLTFYPAMRVLRAILQMCFMLRCKHFPSFVKASTIRSARMNECGGSTIGRASRSVRRRCMKML